MRSAARGGGRTHPCGHVVLVANLDTVKAKNLNQFDGLAPYGCRFSVLTTDALGNSRQVAQASPNVEVVTADPARIRSSMLGSLLQLLRTRRFHLAELYPSSHLALVMAAMVKAWRLPLVIVARGEEWYYLTGQMSRRQRQSFRMTYRLADHVIYKETYMEPLLRDLGKRSAWMLPNAVRVPERTHVHEPGRCTLLYMNSMKDFRHPKVPLEAFLRICQRAGLRGDSPIRMRIVGFQGERASDPVVRSREAELRRMVAGRDVPVELHPWTTEPGPWLDQADVFLLPADVVFLNYTLLEAMSREVAPVVQATDASDRILTHGESGCILPLSVDAWEEAMEQLIGDHALRARLGRAARARVQECFSLEAWAERYHRIYESVAGGRT